MKTSAVITNGFRSSVARLMVWRGDRLQDVTDNPHPDVLATVAGFTADALALVPSQHIPAIIGELERIKLALSARLAGVSASASDDGDSPSAIRERSSRPSTVAAASPTFWTTW